jgi:hypothetical protein
MLPQFNTQDIHRVIVSRIHTRRVYHATAITGGRFCGDTS